jgi:hypothetical protein
LLSSEYIPFNIEGGLSTKRLLLQLYCLDYRLCHI